MTGIGEMRDLPGQDDPLYQTWVMLLNGYGYNWYRLDNQLQADDLLIRSQASQHLGTAATHLRDIEGNYRRKYLPPPSREQPYPDPAHLAAARRIRALTDGITDVDTRLRGAAIPPDDKVWARHRDHVETLAQLSRCDVVLLGATQDLAKLVAELPRQSAPDDAAEARIEQQLAYLNSALAARGALLG